MDIFINVSQNLWDFEKKINSIFLLVLRQLTVILQRRALPRIAGAAWQAEHSTDEPRIKGATRHPEHCRDEPRIAGDAGQAEYCRDEPRITGASGQVEHCRDEPRITGAAGQAEHCRDEPRITGTAGQAEHCRDEPRITGAAALKPTLVYLGHENWLKKTSTVTPSIISNFYQIVVYKETHT